MDLPLRLNPLALLMASHVTDSGHPSPQPRPTGLEAQGAFRQALRKGWLEEAGCFTLGDKEVPAFAPTRNGLMAARSAYRLVQEANNERRALTQEWEEKMKSTKILSVDAIILGLGFLRGSRGHLSFGGEGATKRITERGRAALQELLDAGYAEPIEGEDGIPNREHYRGVDVDPHLGELARQRGLNIFDPQQAAAMKWPVFEAIPEAEEDKCPSL